MDGEDQPTGKRHIVVLLIGVVIVAAIVLGIYYVLKNKRPSPEELVDRALHAATVTEQERACLELVHHGKEAAPYLRQVLSEAKAPESRAAAIEGLGSIGSWDSLPQLLDAVEKDESPKVRGRAAAVIGNFFGADYGYNPLDPPEKRKQRTQMMRKIYEFVKKNPPPQLREE